MCDLLRSAVLSVHALTLPKQMESFLVKYTTYLKKTLKTNTGLPLIQALVTTSFW